MQQLSERVTYLRESYELVARMFAAGMTPTMISRRTGFSMRRLNLLWNDPTFQERYQQYCKLNIEALETAALEYKSLADHNALAAMRQLKDKIDEADMNDEFLPTRELITIASDWADRFGYSKRATQLNVNVDFASALDRAIERSGKAKLIEAQALPPDSRLSPIEQVGSEAPQPHTARPARPTLASALNGKSFKRRF